MPVITFVDRDISCLVYVEFDASTLTCLTCDFAANFKLFDYLN